MPASGRVDGERPVGSATTKVSTRPSWSSTARRWSTASRPAVSGGCGRRLPTCTTRPGRRVHRCAELARRPGPASRLVYSEPGASTTWSASAMAAIASGCAGASPGTSSTWRMRPAARGTATWPSTDSAFDVCLQHDPLRRRRQHPAHRAEQPAGLVERGDGIARASRPSPTSTRLPERVPVELALVEAVLERLGPRLSSVGERDQALAQVTRRRHAELAAQPAGRAAVVGRRSRSRSRRRRSADRRATRRRARARLRARRPARPVEHVRHGRGPGWRRARRTRGREDLRELLGDHHAAVVPAGATDADREVGLALVDERRAAAARTAARAPRGTASPRAGRARSSAPSSVPGNGRRSSTQCGLGRKRQSKSRSTSTGMPCLYPNDTMLVCIDCASGSPSQNSSLSRSRSSWTLRFDVSTTRSACPFTSSSSSRSRRDAVDHALGVGERVAAARRLEPADEHVVVRIEEDDARAHPSSRSSASAAFEVVDELAGADVDHERRTGSGPRARASSATFGISAGGRLSITKKPEVLEHVGCGRAPGPGQPGDDRDVDGAFIGLQVAAWAWASASGRRRVESLVRARAPPRRGARGARRARPRSAPRSLFTEPNSRSRRARRAGPSPGTSSSTDAIDALAAQLAVVRDREAVGFVAHLLEEDRAPRSRVGCASGSSRPGR